MIGPDMDFQTHLSADHQQPVSPAPADGGLVSPCPVV